MCSVSSQLGSAKCLRKKTLYIANETYYLQQKRPAEALSFDVLAHTQIDVERDLPYVQRDLLYTKKRPEEALSFDVLAARAPDHCEVVQCVHVFYLIDSSKVVVK